MVTLSLPVCDGINFTKMSSKRNTPRRRPSKNHLCRYFYAGFLSATLMMTLIYFNISESYNYMRPAIASYHSLLSRARFTPDEKMNLSHLQTLREMFTNGMKKQRDLHVKLNKSSCMSMDPADFSDLEELEQKTKVLLMVIVSTAPTRQDRRAAIRETWWSKCKGTISCRFFTDGLRVSKEQTQQLAQEKRIHKDIEFQPIVGGRTFGLRYLYHVMWASAKYDFSYFLRIDDDYFVCIERLLHELDYRPGKVLSWGWYHCNFRNLLYADEAWTLFSRDVIERFLSQDPNEILCHPHADQQIAIWINNVYKNRTTLIYFDDRRLHNYPPAKEMEKFKSATRVCDSFMGVHGSSPELMRRFWNNSSDGAKEITALTNISQTCDKPNVFDISLMARAFKFDLKPCIENPQWNPEEQMWLGIHAGVSKTTSPC